MNLTTEPFDELPKDRGISRMIVLSAVLHVVVIGFLIISGQLQTPPPREPLMTSYEVSLVGPIGTGKAKSSGEKTPTSARPSEEKPTPGPAKGEQRVDLPPKLAEPEKPKLQEKPKSAEPAKPKQQDSPKPVEQAKLKAPEKPKVEEPVKPKSSEPPSPKPVEQAKPKNKRATLGKTTEIAKESEPPKPKPTPEVKEKEIAKPKPALVAKEPEPPKAVAVAKPVEKKPPPLPVKEKEVIKVPAPVQPKADVQASEKKQKPKEQTPTPSEPVKAQEKIPEAKKKEEQPKAQPVSAQPEKKQPSEAVKAATPTKSTSPQKQESVDTPAKKQPATVPAAAKAVSSSEDTAQARQDEEAREKLIASAVERVRSREESVSRERDIAKAIDAYAVMLAVALRADKKKTPKLAAAPSMSIEKGSEHDQGGKGKVYGPEFIAYTESIKQKVKDGWILADRKPGLRAVVRFGVETNGGVVDVELVDPSGDRAFDQSALRAVRNAKLPPPPETYREDFALQKVNITFGGEE